MRTTALRAVLVIVCSTLVAAGAAVAQPSPTPAAARPAGAGDAQLRALLAELVAAGATGVVAEVDDGQRVLRLTSGVARLEPRQRLTPAARFRAGSITKSFVAVVALQLVGRGTLRLDDTVERWLPGLVPDGDAITLRMLLNHTSGLFDFTADEAFLAALLADPTRRWSPEELVAVATAHPPLFAPGAGWGYSSTGFVVAGLMIEAATGRDLEGLIEHRIIEPLRLTRTAFPVDPDIAGYHAHAYLPPSLTGAGYLDVTRLSPSVVWAGGALVSNAADLRTFYEALLGGRLLSRPLLAHLLTTVEVAPGFDYGLGIYAERSPCGTVWGHNGGIMGYVTWAYADRGGRRSVVVTTSTEPDATLFPIFERIRNAAVCRMFGQRPPAAARSQAPRPATLGAGPAGPAEPALARLSPRWPG